MEDFDTDDRPEWPSQLVKNVLGDDGWDDPDTIALHDEVVPDDTFVSAAHQMLAQLRSGSVKISSKSSLMALTHMKQPWARDIDVEMSTISKDGVITLLLWRHPTFVIELVGRGRRLAISSGPVESLLIEREQPPEVYEEQFDAEVGTSEEAVELRFAGATRCVESRANRTKRRGEGIRSP